MSASVPDKAAARTDSKDEQPGPIILDLGRKKRKYVKKLRKGNGKLLDEVMDAVDELCRVGTVPKSAQPVIVIVREKRRPNRMFPLLGK
jgi:hypothetical protein